MSQLYWKRHPEGPFVTFIAVAATYLHPETYDLDSLKALAKLEDDEEMRVFKSELREALRDPSQLPGDELSIRRVRQRQRRGVPALAVARTVRRRAFRRRHQRAAQGAAGTFRRAAAPAGRRRRLHAARAGEWAEALDVLLAALINTNAPVSAAERDELAALLEATGQPAGAAARLSVSQPGAPGQHRYGDDAGKDA